VAADRFILHCLIGFWLEKATNTMMHHQISIPVDLWSGIKNFQPFPMQKIAMMQINIR
jgi:hypothetical protein